MNCRRAEELFVDYLYGELPKDISEEVEAHLRECPRCRETADNLSSARGVMQSEGPLGPSAIVEQRILRTAREACTPSGRRPLLRWVTVAVPLGAIAAVVLFVVHPLRLDRQEVAHGPARIETTAPGGDHEEEKRLGLPRPSQAYKAPPPPPSALEETRESARTDAAMGAPPKDSPIPPISRAEELLGHGDYLQALKVFDSLLDRTPRTDPLWARALLGRARALEALGRIKDAVKDYRALSTEDTPYRDIARKKIRELESTGKK